MKIIFKLLVTCNFLFCFFNVVAQNKLNEGDILFQNLNCGPLCDAIEAVTKGVGNKSFSHCAMVVNVNDTLKVIEAIGGAVQINSIKNFFIRSGDTSVVKNITVGRLKLKYKKLILSAVSFTKNQVGKPYDDEFILNNGAWYCSELVYEAFKVANNNISFFSLQPMTFKQPYSKNYFPAWVDYYKQLQKPIPEGKLGCNPGLLSRSTKISIVK
jgi:hypothetical protein